MTASWISRTLCRRLRPYVPLLAMLGVLGMSSIPGAVDGDASATLRVFVWLPPSIQNLLHIPAYATLAFLWNWSLAGSLRPRQASLLTLVIVICFGIFDEWYQSFTPGRYSSWMDVLFDAVGAVIGVLVFRYFNRA